jgi:hypothetical protein
VLDQVKGRVVLLGTAAVLALGAGSWALVAHAANSGPHQATTTTTTATPTPTPDTQAEDAADDTKEGVEDVEGVETQDGPGVDQTGDHQDVPGEKGD